MSLPRARAALLHACGLLGALTLAAGIALLYLQRGLFDSEAFAERLSRSLEDPRVAALLADRVTDAILHQAPDLTAFRPLVRGAAQGVVSSWAFRATLRTTARTAHATAFSPGGRELLLSVQDVDLLLRSVLAQASPEVAAKIPPRVQAAVGSVGATRATRALLQLGQQGRRLARFAWVLIAGGMLLLLLGILLEPDRQRGLLLASYDLVGAGLMLALLLPLGRAALGMLATGPTESAGVAGLFDAFAFGLRGFALGLAGIGLVFGAAAHSLLEDVGVAEVLRRLARLVDDPPGGVPGRIVRAFLLLIFGLLAVAEPQAAVGTLTLLAGAGTAFLGLLELFRLVQSGLLRGRAPSLGKALAVGASTGSGLRRVALVLAVAFVLAAVVAFLARPETLPAPKAELADACNGAAALCERRVDQVVFPGAHNAMSSADVDRWMFPQQEKGAATMLAEGVRALLVDVHYGRPVLGSEQVKTDLDAETASREKMEGAVGKEGLTAAMRIRDRLTGREVGPRGLYLCHGFCELGAQPLVPWLGALRDFLAAHPGEVIVIVFEDYVEPAELAAAFEESGLSQLVYRGEAKPPWPTLRELVDSRQRVLAFLESGKPDVPWLRSVFAAVQETPYRFKKPDEFSCAPHRGGTAGSLFQINHWIDTTPDPKPSNAAIVNAYDFLLARARRCESERKKLPNLVAVDFYRTGDLLRVARTLNNLDREGQPSEQP